MANDAVQQSEVEQFATQVGAQGVSRSVQDAIVPSGASWGTQAAPENLAAAPMQALQGNSTDQQLALQVMQAYEQGGAQGAAALGGQFDALSLQDQQAVAQDIYQMSGGSVMAGIQGDNAGNSTLLIGTQGNMSQIDWGGNVDQTGLSTNAAMSLIQGDATDNGGGGGGGGAASGGGGW